MEYSKKAMNEELHRQLKEYVYNIIGCMHYVHKELGPGLVEYVYQEALYKKLKKEGFGFQTHGYLRGTGFPIGLLVNFGTYPHSEIERYYYKDNSIWAF